MTRCRRAEMDNDAPVLSSITLCRDSEYPFTCTLMSLLISDRLLDVLPQLLFLLLVSWLIYTISKALKPRNHHSMRTVAILVLGDIGRSPRMMYHAQSFAELGFVTDLIGYAGTLQSKRLLTYIYIYI